MRSSPSTSATIVMTLAGSQCLPYDGTQQTGSGYTWLHLNHNGQVNTLFLFVVGGASGGGVFCCFFCN
jgi:hypothetical protein